MKVKTILMLTAYYYSPGFHNITWIAGKKNWKKIPVSCVFHRKIYVFSCAQSLNSIVEI